MLLDQSKIKMLLRALVLTNETEVDCDACFDAMAEFAESQLSGASVVGEQRVATRGTAFFRRPRRRYGRQCVGMGHGLLFAPCVPRLCDGLY